MSTGGLTQPVCSHNTHLAILVMTTSPSGNSKAHAAETECNGDATRLLPNPRRVSMEFHPSTDNEDQKVSSVDILGDVFPHFC